MTQKIIFFFMAWLLAGTLTFAQTKGEDVEALESIIAANYTNLSTFIQAHADEIKADDSDVDVSYCLQQLGGNTFDAQFGPFISSLVEVGCMHGFEACDIDNLYGLMDTFRQNGADVETLQQIEIFLGSELGSNIGEAACDGVPECEALGGRIGATLACLSVSKEIMQKITSAISSLKNVVNQVGEFTQDTIDTISNTAKSVNNQVQTAMDQISQGAENDAVSALKGATDQIASGMTDVGNAIAGAVNTAVGAVAGAGQQAVDAVGNAGQQAVDAVGNGATQAADEVGNGATQAADAVASGFCGIFGC